MNEVRHLWHRLEQARPIIDEAADRLARQKAMANREGAPARPLTTDDIAADLDDRMAALKAEITSLREIFFERDEDRSRAILDFQRLERRTKADLALEGDRLDGRIDALGDGASAGAAAFEEALRAIRHENAALAAQVEALREQLRCKGTIWRRIRSALRLGAR